MLLIVNDSRAGEFSSRPVLFEPVGCTTYYSLLTTPSNFALLRHLSLQCIVMSKPKPAPDDWRRMGQERVLHGVTLVRRAYQPSRPSWDHDHCEFCHAKFSMADVDHKNGFATADGYRWVCVECFADFREEFAWVVADADAE